jgi:cobalt-precorrin 5A hydrolase
MKVAGFGFRKAASVTSLRDALTATGDAGGVTHVATVDGKAEAAVFLQFAKTLGLPVLTIPADQLSEVKVLSVSTKSDRLWGTGSLSEAVALLAAGPGARLSGLRVISSDSMATCAIATGDAA